MTPDSTESARDDAQTRPADSADARHAWLLVQQQQLLDAMTRVRRTQGVEAIHATRVAARRIRAALSAWRDDCHPLLMAELWFELRNLGRLLAPVREADVRRQLVAALLRSPPPELGHAVALTVAGLDQARAAARQVLRHALRHARWRRCIECIQAMIADERLLAVARPTDTLAAEGDDLRNRIRKLRKQLARARPHHARLHALRIRAKALRYRAEAGSELGDTSLGEELKLLRQIQTALGDIHDGQQLTAWVNTAALDARVRELIRTRLAALTDRQRKQLAKLQPRRSRKSAPPATPG